MLVFQKMTEECEMNELVNEVTDEPLSTLLPPLKIISWNISFQTHSRREIKESLKRIKQALVHFAVFLRVDVLFLQDIYKLGKDGERLLSTMLDFMGRDVYAYQASPTNDHVFVWRKKTLTACKSMYLFAAAATMRFLDMRTLRPLFVTSVQFQDDMQFKHFFETTYEEQMNLRFGLEYSTLKVMHVIGGKLSCANAKTSCIPGWIQTRKIFCDDFFLLNEQLKTNYLFEQRMLFKLVMISNPVLLWIQRQKCEFDVD